MKPESNKCTAGKESYQKQKALKSELKFKNISWDFEF